MTALVTSCAGAVAPRVSVPSSSRKGGRAAAGVVRAARHFHAFRLLPLLALAIGLHATEAPAVPGQRIQLAPYTETQLRPAWFRKTQGYCPGAEIHRRTLDEVFLAVCPGGPDQWAYHHWDPQPGNPQWGDLYCTNPNTGAVEFAGTLNDACGAEGEQCEVPFPGFVGKGGLAGAYCEKVTTRCPVGYDPSGGKCVVSPWGPPVDKSHMGQPLCLGDVANPLELYYGNKYQIETDYEGAGSFPLRFVRYYNSPNTFVVPLQTDLAVGALGKSIWSHSYSGRIVLASGGGLETAYVWRGDGKVVFFTLIDGVWTPDADVSHRLERLADGGGNPSGWRLITADGERTETYDASGRLLTIASRAGLTHSLSYNPQGQLASVSDGLGRSLVFAYTLDGFISTMTDPAGKVYQYAYHTDYRLQSVTYPGSGTRTYHYELSDPRWLTGISDENGSRFTTYTYDGYWQSKTSERAGGVLRYEVNRPTYAGSTSVTVTDPLGTVRTYTSEKIMGALRTTGISGPSCPDHGPAAMSYDVNGNIASRTDWNGNRTCFQHEPTRNLEVVRGEGLTGACPTDLASWTPAGGTVQRKITTEWDTSWRLPTKVCEPKRITTLAYDASGNVTSRSVQATSDAQGALGCSAAPVGTPRTWTYAYTYGTTNPGVAVQVVVDGPRTDVADTTTLLFEEATGNLLSVANAKGHVTSFGDYDAHGKPREIIDPNGLVTTLVYDDRQRLTSRTVGAETTGYTYDNVGQLTRVTFPDASYVEYVYDAAHRLTEVRDNLGNKIVYALDAMGNRTREDVYDASSTLVATRSHEYNSVNRKVKDIGGTSPATQIVQYGYDPQGNLTSIDGPLAGSPNDLTVLAYDALNRLKQVTDALSGVAAYGYDALDQLASVTDPRGLATAYTVSGLDDETLEVSPDRGSTTRTFDAAGNVKTSTDARGKTTTYTYDELGRVTKHDFTSGTDSSFEYDGGAGGAPNAKARLTKTIDEAAATTWTYNAQGRVASKTQVTGSNTLSVAYGYDAYGRLASITYPSGKVVTFGFDAAGRVNAIAVGATTILSGASYFPFGAVKGFTWGNGLAYARTFDADGRLLSFPVGASTRTITYDEAGRITWITDSGTPGLDLNAGYDVLDRLTSSVGYPANQSYSYDANGNRTSVTIGATSYPYTVASTSNRLNATAGPAPAKTLTYDAAGNVTADGTQTFVYSNRGRMSSTTRGSSTVSYKYNALGERLRKQGPTSLVSSGTNRFVYDEQGRLLGEYKSAGALIQEYVYLGDQPVAILQGTSASPVVFYVYADQVNAPRLVTNTANQERWRWDSAPFGDIPPNENPAGLGAFTLNLRFPGQYFDKETNLHYNYFRDYDPAIGRYVQSDPVGLAGGLNSYLYVEANPLSGIDPTGEGFVVPLVLAGLLIAGSQSSSVQNAAANAATYWAELQVETGNWLFGIPGALATLADPCNARTTATVLGVATAAGAYLGRPFWQYYPAGNPAYSSSWLTRGWGWRPPYQSGQQAAQRLSLPPWNPGTAVRPVTPSPFRYVAGPRTVQPQPQWGQPGGGVEFRLGGFPR